MFFFVIPSINNKLLGLFIIISNVLSFNLSYISFAFDSPIPSNKSDDKKSTIEDTLNKNFYNFFSEPVDCKQSLRKLVMSYAS